MDLTTSEAIQEQKDVTCTQREGRRETVISIYI